MFASCAPKMHWQKDPILWVKYLGRGTLENFDSMDFQKAFSKSPEFSIRIDFKHKREWARRDDATLLHVVKTRAQ